MCQLNVEYPQRILCFADVYCDNEPTNSEGLNAAVYLKCIQMVNEILCFRKKKIPGWKKKVGQFVPNHPQNECPEF